MKLSMIMKKSLIISTVLALVFAAGAFATPQSPDYLYYREEWYRIDPVFLEMYFDRNEISMPDYLKVVNYEGDTSRYYFASTGCYRGYMATLQIDSLNRLYIEEMAAEIELIDKIPSEKPYSIIRDYFNGRARVWLGNYNGVLLAPYKDRGLGGWYGGGEPEPDRTDYTLFEIVDGVCAQVLSMNYEELQLFKKEQFGRFKKTPAYEELLEKTKEERAKLLDNMIEEKVSEENIRQYIESSSNFLEDFDDSTQGHILYYLSGILKDE